MTTDLVAAILRSDFYSFVQASFPIVSPHARCAPNWHIEAMAFALTRVFEGEIKRLLASSRVPLYWRWRSTSRHLGRPKTSRETQHPIAVVVCLSKSNPNIVVPENSIRPDSRGDAE
jgi:hypothetical protein